MKDLLGAWQKAYEMHVVLWRFLKNLESLAFNNYWTYTLSSSWILLSTMENSLMQGDTCISHLIMHRICKAIRIKNISIYFYIEYVNHVIFLGVCN